MGTDKGSASGTSLIALSRHQQVALDLVPESLRSESTIRLIISGGESTGKSTLISVIVHSTREFCGRTADKNLSYKKLEAERRRRMQVDFKGTKLIIIDEYNMIDIKMLANIDLSSKRHFFNKRTFWKYFCCARR
ncbi:uncharacterized protein LOC113314177 [Papaver somniferum]|uniref:uncharacterized protein LOC113314177 n=1 Tax=Papaver somniferum TaxID=3469 RepID=UPI000E704F19|nr:uncharacterized protein LOC113314177 [Papaver somniferum]